MKCYICDATLSPNEISENPDHGDFDPCGKCQEIIDSVFEAPDEKTVKEQLDKELEEDLENFSLDNSP